MGAFSYVSKTLGLSLTPRIKEIIELVKDNKDIDKKDMLYLIDEAARFETIRKRINTKNYTVSPEYSDNEYEVHELLKGLMDELLFLDASKLTKENKYIEHLRHFDELFSKSSSANFTSDYLSGEIRRSMRHIKEMQKSFDKSGDDIKVVGIYQHLKKLYGVEIQIDSTSKESDITSEIAKKVSASIKIEQDREQKKLKAFEKLI